MATIAAAATLWLVLAPRATPAQAEKRRPGLNSSELRKVEAIVKRYFKEGGADRRRVIATELEPFDHPSRRDIVRFRKLAFRLVRKSGPRQKGKGSVVTCTHPDYPGRYILRAPKSARRKKTGLFIGLHGGGEGVGDGAAIERSFGKFDAKFINVYPTVVKKERAAWNREREERYVLAIIEELKRTYKIDTNRIYIAGHSMGGFGTWSIAGRHPDVFAGASAMAGGQYGPGVIPNLLNLPIYVYHATDDARVPPDSDQAAIARLEALRKTYGPFRFVWKLYTGIGHGFPTKGVKPIFDWMRKHVRDPYPKRILWERSRDYKTRLYWIGKSRGRALVDVRREGNAFVVEGNREGLSLYLNEKMVDFRKAITVRSGNETLVNRIVPYSLETLIGSIRDRNDPEMYFTARIDLSPRR